TAMDAAGRSQLWLRSVDSDTARPLAGTEEGFHPFWSPGAESIGFFAGPSLKRVSLSGGAPAQVLCDTGQRGGARATRHRDGTTLFSRADESGRVLHRIAASGGTSQPVTTRDQDDLYHAWPQFLPDGQRFLYFVYSRTQHGASSVFLGSLDATPPRRLLHT